MLFGLMEKTRLPFRRLQWIIYQWALSGAEGFGERMYHARDIVFQVVKVRVLV